MTYRSHWAIVCLFVVAIFFSQSALAQDDSFQAYQDTLLMELDGSVARQASDLKSMDELHLWFDKEISNLYYENYNDSSGLGKRLVPRGVYSLGSGEIKDRYSLWNYGMDYQYPTQTINAFMTIMNGKLGSANWWVKGMFGTGLGDVDGFPSLDTDGTALDQQVSSSLGLNLELGWQKPQWYFNPLVGMSLVWINAENDGIASGQGTYMYVGDRLFLNNSRTLSLDLKGGFAMWRGFDFTYADGTGPNPVNPNDYFASAGLTIHRDINLGKVGKPLFGPLELGLMYTLPFDALETRILAPMRFYKELSLAPVLGFGPGIGDIDFSLSKSVGLEIRMFGDVVRPVPSLNPYLGVRKFWVSFDGANKTLGGVNAYLGSRFYFSDKFAVDLNAGPSFWDDDPASDGYVGYSPDSWVAQLGVSVALGKVDPAKSFSGTIVTVDSQWGELSQPRQVYNPLKAEDNLVEGGEVRVYALEQASARVDTVVSYQPSHMGDLSDLKYFSLALDLEIGFKPFNSKANLVSGSEGKSKEVLLAVLFNKEHTQTQMLNERNTFFHFVDFDHGQYFGYRWDANRNRQPEYRDMDDLGEVAGSGGQLYWGNHDEFVKPVKWLANDTVLDFINGRAVELRLLEMMDQHFSANDTVYASAPTPERLQSLVSNYKIAYVKYPESTINKMRGFITSGNFGVSLMVADNVAGGEDLYIRAKDANWAAPMGMPEDIHPDAKVRLDSANHNYFFSNPVRIEEIITDDMSLSGFEECSAVLNDMHRGFLNSRVLNRLWSNPKLEVVLTGFTDATPLGEECRQIYGAAGQRGLSLARAQSAADYLIANGISAGRISVQGTGVKVNGRFSWQDDRSVDVKFTEGN